LEGTNRTARPAGLGPVGQFLSYPCNYCTLAEPGKEVKTNETGRETSCECFAAGAVLVMMA